MLLDRTTPIIFSDDKVKINILSVEDIFNNLINNKIKIVYMWNGRQWVEIEELIYFKDIEQNSSFIVSKNSCVKIVNTKKYVEEEIQLCKLPKNFICTEKKLDNFECEFIGLIVGDGHIDTHNKKVRFINKSSELRNHAIFLYEQICQKHKRNIENPYYYPSKSGFKEDSIVGYLDFNLFWFLNRLDIYNNDKTKKVPEFILNTSIENKLSFLDGYNKADGLKKNKCIYKYKNFKTNSPTLATGLIFLIKETTTQDFNINIEKKNDEDGIERYYYSINLLSDSRFSKAKSIEKEKIILEKIEEGLSQREIEKQTQISRTFIRKIQHGYKPKQKDQKCIENNKIKKILNENSSKVNAFYQLKLKEPDSLLIGIGCGLYEIK